MTFGTHLALVAFVFTFGVVANEGSVCSSAENCADAATSEEDATSLMQMRLSAARRGSRDDHATEHVDKKSQCSSLVNKGAYFTAEVGIGTPEQIFNLVADTGSDALIFPDCRCVQSGFCAALSNCFDASNSTSFGLDIKPSPNQNSLDIMGAKMNYGSGQIQVLVASETVRVASAQTQMKNGVFLMEDRRALAVHGDFEGILGLGLPHKKKLTKQGVEIPVFMEASATKKYQLCFNEYPKPGALRVGIDSTPNALTNIGTVHWGLDLQGFSVGGATEPVLFCDPKSMKKEQKTACGAIPDSGTTLMMGPPDHIKKLYGELCEKWPRCKNASETYGEDKAKAFHELLGGCESWMTDDQGVNEIPSIFIHLAGAEGVSQKVELSAWAFVVETTKEIYKVVTAKVFGAVPIQAAVDTGKKKKVCTASFGPQEYNTELNGPVWIMGAPLFYATNVGYDLGSKGAKAKISFTDGKCKMCSEDDEPSREPHALISSANAIRATSDNRAAPRPLRWLDGPLREPNIDANNPL